MPTTPKGTAVPKLLTTNEVARHLAVDPSTVRRWIDAGQLAAVKPGRAYRVHPDELRAFVVRSRVTSQALTA